MKKKVCVMVLLAISIISVMKCITAADNTPPLIRLHILANSNSQEDQRIKYMVRDRVVAEMKEKFRESTSFDESKAIMLESLQGLEETARTVLREEGCQDDVKAYYGIYDFPAKYYGTFSLGAGRYEAVKLVLGEGAGANWWCVLFPPLCFVDGEENQKAAALAIEAQQRVELKPTFAVVKLYNKIVTQIKDK